jgi:hypothetical protein
MKLTTIAVLTLMVSLIWACGNESSSNAGQGANSASPATTTSPAAGSVQHYTCPNNCAGSGGETAGTCPVCGTAYVHNDAYHSQPNNAPAQEAPTAAPELQMQPPTAEPAQNAAGVWHYICSAGCAGGSGTQGNCPMCGASMQHNQAYHQ